MLRHRPSHRARGLRDSAGAAGPSLAGAGWASGMNRELLPNQNLHTYTCIYVIPTQTFHSVRSSASGWKQPLPPDGASGTSLRQGLPSGGDAV